MSAVSPHAADGEQHLPADSLGELLPPAADLPVDLPCDTGNGDIPFGDFLLDMITAEAGDAGGDSAPSAGGASGMDFGAFCLDDMCGAEAWPVRAASLPATDGCSAAAHDAKSGGDTRGSAAHDTAIVEAKDLPPGHTNIHPSIQPGHQPSNQWNNEIVNYTGNEPSNQQNNQPNNQWNNEIINYTSNDLSNQQNNQTNNQAFNHLVNPLNHQPGDQQSNQLNNQAINQMSNPLNHQPNNQPINQQSNPLNHQQGNPLNHQQGNQPNNQSINPLNNQPINQQSNPLYHQLSNHANDQSIIQPNDPLNHQPNNQPFNHQSDEPINQAFNHLVNPLNHQPSDQQSNQLSNSLNHQPNNQPINQQGNPLNHQQSNQPNNQSINSLNNQPINQLSNLPINESMNQTNNQLNDRAATANDTSVQSSGSAPRVAKEGIEVWLRRAEQLIREEGVSDNASTAGNAVTPASHGPSSTTSITVGDDGDNKESKKGDEAFNAQVAHWLRRGTEVQESALATAANMQLRMTQLLQLFGAHSGLAGLLGQQYAATPAVLTLPLVLPMIESLLEEE